MTTQTKDEAGFLTKLKLRGACRAGFAGKRVLGEGGHLQVSCLSSGCISAHKLGCKLIA